MKPKILIFLLLFTQLLFSQGFVVKSFSSDIYLSNQGYFDVVEKYQVDFTENKHGLLRNIITGFDFKNEKGKIEKRKIYITDIKVPGENFTTSSQFSVFDNQLQIKIGDKDKLIFGEKNYEIRYRVTNALIFTDNLAMLYWNVKPSDWKAEFQEVNFRIHTPKGAIISPENCFTYSGISGNTEVSKDFEYNFVNRVYSGISHPGVQLSPGESVTVLVKLPKNLISESNLWYFYLKEYSWLGILLFVWFWIRKSAKKLASPKVLSVTSYYPPEGIDPPMAGYLIDDSGDNSDLISLLPKWGNEGLIRMEELSKSSIFSSQNIKIIKLKDLSNEAPVYEKIIFYGLFSDMDALGKSMSSISLNDLLNKKSWEDKWAEVALNLPASTTEVETKDMKDKFYQIIEAGKLALKQKAAQYYDSSKETSLKVMGCLLGLLWVLIPIAFFYFFGIIAAVVGGIFITILFFVYGTLHRKNPQGEKILSELKGFKQFIKLADLNRIKELLKEDPNYFEKTMSYALAFGMLEKWAKQFESLGASEPDWYHGSTISGMSSSGGFAQSFASGMAAAQSSMVSSPSGSSSSGGGSSGGGGGGGGGGSW